MPRVKSLMERYWDDYNSEFEQPQMSPLTVGFSRIDPDRQHSTGLTLAEIMKHVIDYIDGLDLDDHESLKNLKGGDSTNGHWHLTVALLRKLTDMPDGMTDDHEKLKGLLGGNAAGHYHLTKAQVEKVDKAVTEDTNTYKHEELTGLLGGNAAGHYHLTSEQVTKLADLTKAHNSLTGLQGGSSTERYHVTQELANKLATLHSVLSHETWAFALDSDPTVTVNKEVVLWATV